MREFRYTGRFREPSWRGPSFVRPATVVHQKPRATQPCPYCGGDCCAARGCFDFQTRRGASGEPKGGTHG